MEMIYLTKIQTYDKKNQVKELNKWRENLCSYIGKHSFVKMPALPKLIYRFNATPVKISASYLMDFDKLILKCM